jgi:hypothetical protein
MNAPMNTHINAAMNTSVNTFSNTPTNTHTNNAMNSPSNILSNSSSNTSSNNPININTRTQNRIEEPPQQMVIRQPASVEVATEAIIDCVNNAVDINAIEARAIAKVPVLLGELTISLNVNSIVSLPERVYEIKQIKRRLRIIKCALLHNTNILFIKGFVQKNIEYTTNITEYGKLYYSDIHNCTVEIPFSCTTNVVFNGIEPAPLKSNSTSDIQVSYKDDAIKKGFFDNDESFTNDVAGSDRISTFFYNEIPFCELASSKIVESFEAVNNKNINYTTPLKQGHYDRLEENMVIYLTIMILQYRKVIIPPPEK